MQQLKRPEVYNHLTKYSSKKKKTEINQSAEELAQGVEKEIGRPEIKVKVELGDSAESVKEEMDTASQELKETVARLEKKLQKRGTCASLITLMFLKKILKVFL